MKAALSPVYGQHRQATNPSVAYRRQLPNHRGADRYPESLPCGWGGAAQRRRGCEGCPISRLRATPASYQPLSRLIGASSPCTGQPISTPPYKNVPRGTFHLSQTGKKSKKSGQNVPRGTFWGGFGPQNRPKCQNCRRSLSIVVLLWYNILKTRPGTPRQAVQHDFVRRMCQWQRW